MITEESLAFYPDLCRFISANDESQRQIHMVNLRDIYALYLKKNQVSYDVNPNIAQNYSALEVVAMLGKCEHVHTLFFSSLRRWGGRDGHSALILAAKAGHLDVVKALFESSISVENTIRSQHRFHVWKAAAKSGNLDLIEYLFQQLPIQSLVANEVNLVLLGPVLEGHLHMVERLLKDPYVLANVTPSPCLQRAVNYQRTDIVHRLLSIPAVFNYADEANVYAVDYLRPFVMQRIQILEEIKSRSGPMFDMNENDAHLCFYMIKFFIRQNDASDHPHIAFLLSIANVRRLLTWGVTPTIENELLRIAIQAENDMAEACLLSFTTVRAHAEQHDYYGNVQAKIRQKQRDKQLKKEVRLASFCFLQLIHNATLSGKNNKKIDVFVIDILYYDILSYLLPNPYLIQCFEKKFHDNTVRFFTTVTEKKTKRNTVVDEMKTSLSLVDTDHKLTLKK